MLLAGVGVKTAKIGGLAEAAYPVLVSRRTPLLTTAELWFIAGAVAVAASGLAVAIVQNQPRARVVRAARSEIGRCDPTRYASASGDKMPAGTSWCGIFALWSLRKAGVTDWDWEWNVGFTSRLQRTSNPQPGDIAYRQYPFQHQAIVESVSNGYVVTINGNSDNGCVVRKREPISSWTAFFSIEPMIRASRGLGALKLAA